jgi:hypothetical protein
MNFTKGSVVFAISCEHCLGISHVHQTTTGDLYIMDSCQACGHEFDNAQEMLELVGRIANGLKASRQGTDSRE